MRSSSAATRSRARAGPPSCATTCASSTRRRSCARHTTCMPSGCNTSASRSGWRLGCRVTSRSSTRPPAAPPSRPQRRYAAPSAMRGIGERSQPGVSGISSVRTERRPTGGRVGSISTGFEPRPSSSTRLHLNSSTRQRREPTSRHRARVTARQTHRVLRIKLSLRRRWRTVRRQECGRHSCRRFASARSRANFRCGCGCPATWAHLRRRHRLW